MAKGSGADRVARSLRRWAGRRRAAVVALAGDWAAELESRARQDAAWTDLTGDARRGLSGSVLVRRDRVLIVLGHSVDYGVFLEQARDGLYAILRPTIDRAVTEIFATYRRMWKGE